MKRKLLSRYFAMLMMLATSLSFTGCVVETCMDCTPPPPSPPPPPPCVWGPNGVPGPAFFGLDYTTCCPPTYIWTNNTAIPPTFMYGTYYNSMPGTYHLYYEGRVLNGCCYTNYYWDVDFVVWVNAGTAGGCGWAGADGLPSYLMLICDPTGPGTFRTNKLAEKGIETNVILETTDKIIVEYIKGDIHVKVTYTQLSASKKDQLDPAGEITSQVVKK